MFISDDGRASLDPYVSLNGIILISSNLQTHIERVTVHKESYLIIHLKEKSYANYFS